jgi:intracellular multiplication protein IcmK
LNIISIVGALYSSVVFAQALVPSSSMDDSNIDKIAFEEMKQSLSPLSNSQVRDLRNMYNQMNRNEAYSGDVPAKPVASSLIVDLAPGATPPVIRLGAGFITSVLFLDSTGQPWPIKAIDVGDPNLFNVQWNKSAAGEKSDDSMLNTLLIQSKTMFKEGNLAVMLRGLNTPVMITLIPGQPVIDYRVDVQVPRKGPLAKIEESILPMGANQLLLSVLNGIAPPQSKPVRFEGKPDINGWRIGKTLFVRMKETALSPGWYSSMSAADDTMHAYEMPLTSTILVLDNGEMKKIQVEGA